MEIQNSRQRRSFSREFKLKIIERHIGNAKILLEQLLNMKLIENNSELGSKMKRKSKNKHPKVKGLEQAAHQSFLFGESNVR